MPLAGGKPAQIPMHGYRHIIRWPWAHDERDDVLNLVTGERRSAELSDGERRCGPEWCVAGSTEPGYEQAEVVLQRLDGSDQRAFRGR
ncbi:hypothetical protein GCM10010517_01280 [Streptosporangium fragile]|uniref:Uncharacterized protein n=1 Tax=Streptosporangium fragile TaxID=46186 RepID=A0ABP6I5B5_9ACTN